MDRAAAAQTLADALGARGPVRLERFHGGAGPETWLARNGSDRLVLRTDAATRLEESGTRAQEFAALQRAHHAAVPTPQPLHLERDPSVLGAPFFLMSHAPGTARPGDVVSQAGPAFLADCAAALACIHAAPAPGPVDAVARALDEAERRIRWLAPTRPALRYLLTWARVNAPPPAPTVFAHRDFRVGNLLASRGRLTAVIDWEFAGLSEREEDLGWFCAPAWRHGWLERTA
ncbi:MAG: phosphotransferase family protein, partial [Pseudomonadota bacterium]